MKNILYFLLTLSFLSCNVEHKNGHIIENSISLNGNWKFNTIYGQGSNYLNIHEAPSDIIIDNQDKNHLEIKGDWQIKNIGERGSAVHKEDYLSRDFGIGESENNYVRYHLTTEEPGYFEAFVKFPYGNHLTAQVNVNHAEGKTPVHVSQRINCGQWISIGIYSFDASQKSYVEITAITEGGVVADAVMFRPISADVYSEAKKLPEQVYLTDYDDMAWYDLKVPGHWGMINNFSNYTGLAWYRKEFELPQNWKSNKNERIRIKFDGVYHLAKVYLNGQYIGKHQGGFTPFEFEISDQLNFQKTNVLALEVDNNFLVGATWNWGGIIRDVTIEKNQDVRIYNQYIHAIPDLKNGTAQLKLRVSLENNSDRKRSVSISSIIENDKEITTMEQTVEIAANTISDIALEAVLQAEDVSLWHFDQPHLYDLKTTVSEDRTELDRKDDHFGIRQIDITDSGLFLNGEQIRTGGFNRVSEHRYYGSSEPIEVLEKDVDLMKEAGANFMRIMHGTQNKNLIDLCDKKGILLFEEVNVRDLTNPEFSAPDYPMIKGWIKGMVERDINHPSIIGWSVANELAHHYDYAKMMIDYVKEMDPYRLVTCVSNSGQKEAYTRKTDPNTVSDIIMHNMYRWQGEPQEILNTIRSKWPGKPIFISEYGFDPYPTTSLDGDKPYLSEWHQFFRNKNEFVIGTSLWTFNDYRSSYAATSEEENRVWGLVNVWRQKRTLFDRVKKENSPIKDIELKTIDLTQNSAEVKFIIRSMNDYPSYTLRDYSLVWKFRNQKGETVFEKSKALPVLKPSDGEWKGSIAWETLPEDPLDLTVSLVSPTGYSRFDKKVSFSPPLAPVATEIINGDQEARILFKKVAGAEAYYARYSDEKGELVTSAKTIHHFIDADNLSKDNETEINVFAINDKGESLASNSLIAKPNTTTLPPVIWDAFIEDNKLIIGYSSEKGDENYEVNYGDSRDEMNETFSTNVRGMLTIDIQDKSQLVFRIKRKNNSKDSNWSQLISVKK